MPPPAQPIPFRRPHCCVALILVLTFLFAKPLLALASYAWSSDYYSYILLIPAIGVYLFYIRRNDPWPRWQTSLFAAVFSLLLAAVALVGRRALTSGIEQDNLALVISAYLFFLYAAFFLCCGAPAFRSRVFPFLFLLFLIPLPSPVANAVTAFLQVGSAEVSAMMFRWAHMPVFREDLIFHLPEFTIEVARECSGIRSTLVLLITSLLAGQLFLRGRWQQIVLVASVLPIAILRNAFRIVSISAATLYIDPNTLHSPLHNRGGPLYFALSLVPLLLLLVVLRRTERRDGSNR